MKKVLGILAAGILVATPVYMAMADSHDKAAPEAAVEATADAAAAMEHTAPLADGTVVHFEGDVASTVDAEGKKTVLADGDHTLADGTVLTVKEGKVTAGLPVFKDEASKEAAPAEGAAEEKAPE